MATVVKQVLARYSGIEGGTLLRGKVFQDLGEKSALFKKANNGMHSLPSPLPSPPLLPSLPSPLPSPPLSPLTSFPSPPSSPSPYPQRVLTPNTTKQCLRLLLRGSGALLQSLCMGL